MSKLETNTIDSISGTNTLQVGDGNVATINLGKSGDTINIPSGATITNSGTANGFGAVNSPRFLASKASDQSISQGTTTKVTFDNEVYDVGSCFASNKFTVPANEGGTYLLYYNIRINAGAASVVQYVQGAFYKNNAQLTRTEGLDYRNNNGGYSNLVTRSFAIPLDAGDYIEVYVDQAQSSGTPTVRGEGSGILMSTFGGFKILT